MKIRGLVFIAVLAIVACSKNSVLSTKEGWTTAQVSATKSHCIADLRKGGDSEKVATQFCECAITKASQQLSFNDYGDPNDEAFVILTNIQDQCNVGF